MFSEDVLFVKIRFVTQSLKFNIIAARAEIAFDRYRRKFIANYTRKNIISAEDGRGQGAGVRRWGSVSPSCRYYALGIRY